MTNFSASLPFIKKYDEGEGFHHKSKHNMHSSTPGTVRQPREMFSSMGYAGVSIIQKCSRHYEVVKQQQQKKSKEIFITQAGGSYFPPLLYYFDVNILSELQFKKIV